MVTIRRVVLWGLGAFVIVIGIVTPATAQGPSSTTTTTTPAPTSTTTAPEPSTTTVPPVPASAAPTTSAQPPEPSTIPESVPAGDPRIKGGAIYRGSDVKAVGALLDRRYPASSNAFRCGSTLVTSRWVLTAGHCVASPRSATQCGQIVKTPASNLAVGFGSKSLISYDGLGNSRRYRVDQVVLAPGFRFKAGVGTTGCGIPQVDLALLHLSTAVPASVALPAPVHPGTACCPISYVVGWGVTPTSAGRPSTDLRYAFQFRDLACTGYDRALLTGTNVCLTGTSPVPIGGTPPPPGYPCKGDSGSPLLSAQTTSLPQPRRVVAIVSWTRLNPATGCPTAGGPAVYTWVKPWLGWVITTVT
jgi:hypothetical protein